MVCLIRQRLILMGLFLIMDELKRLLKDLSEKAKAYNKMVKGHKPDCSIRKERYLPACDCKRKKV